MKRFTCESKASSSSSTSAASSTKASSRDYDAAMNKATTSVIRCWQDSQLVQLSGCGPISPSLSPSQDEMYVVYTVENLCKGPSAILYRNIFPYKPSDLHPHQSMMSQCLMALARVFYGLQNRESRVLRDGMRLYGRGLSMLSDVLGRDNCSVTTEIIVSVFSLCVAEVCTRPLHNGHPIVGFPDRKSRRASCPPASPHG